MKAPETIYCASGNIGGGIVLFRTFGVLASRLRSESRRRRAAGLVPLSVSLERLSLRSSLPPDPVTLSERALYSAPGAGATPVVLYIADTGKLAREGASVLGDGCLIPSDPRVGREMLNVYINLLDIMQVI